MLNEFKDFFETPPTQSLFRLYLLSFIIYNKSLILYILFSSIDMSEKLKYYNFSYYIFYSEHAYISMYIGPAVISIFLYLVSLYRFIDVSGNKVSIFYWLKYKNIEQQTDYIKKQQDVRIQMNILKNQIYELAPQPMDKEWTNQYNGLKSTLHFKNFQELAETFHGSGDDMFLMEPRYNSDTLNKLVSYLKQRYGINYIYSSNPDDKGYWFVKMYEFERDNGLLKNNNI
jgi:hypothetical protein